MTWLVDDEIRPGTGLSVAKMTVEPGQTSELHSHSNCEEIIVLQSGQIRQRVGDEWFEMSEGDHHVIPMGKAHQTQNIADEAAQLLLVYSDGVRNYKKLD